VPYSHALYGNTVGARIEPGWRRSHRSVSAKRDSAPLAKTKARRRIAKAIQDLKVQVKEVSERNVRYKQIGETVMNTSKVMVDPRALAIFEDASRLVGIDQPKQEVILFLTKEDGGTSSQQPKVVSIVGIGGIGKTTLANLVYQELKDQFQCRAFLSVSRNPDMAKILRTILSQVTGQRYCETEAGSIQQLIMEINDFLRTKRYTWVYAFSMQHFCPFG
jgi:disease resistance protein RPM1